jgi:teichoic acid transport system ATP-binding protein
MSSNEIVIAAHSVTKAYRLYDSHLHRLLQVFNFRKRTYFNEFTALSAISFEISKGEAVGIIGRNGSGKSTLLQLLCGIRKPTSGEVSVNGRISALLELGAGFHPEFTGRENVFMQGAIMGLTRLQMETRLPEILAFADIGKFIDQPVRTYSSGMFVRLAFAVAIHVDPEILVIDEALAVGDLGFQAKCLRKIAELKERGVTIFLVTHNMDQIISHCTRALVLDRGKLISDSNAKHGVYCYQRLLTSRDSGMQHENTSQALSRESEADRSWAGAFNINKGETRTGSGKALILEAGLFAEGSVPSQNLLRQQDFVIRMRIQFLEPLQSPIIFYTISDVKGSVICGTSTFAQGTEFGTMIPHAILDISFGQKMRLNSGEYFLSIGCQTFDGQGHVSHDLRWEHLAFQVLASSPRPGVFDPESSIKWQIESETMAPRCIHSDS